MMNEKAKELGLENTHFITPHGLDEQDHYTSAYELAKITDYALTIEKFANIVNTKEATIHINGNEKQINNTNELLGYLNRGKWRKNRIYKWRWKMPCNIYYKKWTPNNMRSFRRRY